MKKYTSFSLFLTILTVQNAFAQRNETKANDSNTPLHLLQPDYPVPYGKVEIADVTQVLNRLLWFHCAVQRHFEPSKWSETKKRMCIFSLLEKFSSVKEIFSKNPQF